MLLIIKLFPEVAMEISHLKFDLEKAVEDCGDLNRV
jgi:hypothetical protein